MTSSDDEDGAIELISRIKSLERELDLAKEQLEQYGGKKSGKNVSNRGAFAEKRGYLFKWADRSIGWGGSKWALRFVVLESGRLRYFGSHTDTQPRYGVMLRGLGIRDDGWKTNASGAKFYVFSIFERHDDDAKTDNSLDNTVPLLRFSTPSSAEKALWIDLISSAIAYCETDGFLEDEAARGEELARRQEEEKTMAKAMPESRDETLPPLYFAPPISKPKGLTQRLPSVPSFAKRLDHEQKDKSKLKRSTSFQTRAKIRDLDKAEARSKRSYPASKPMHREAASSLLSPDAKTQNFRGFLNLGFLVLLLSNFRLLLENIRAHGFAFQLTIPSVGDILHDPWQHFPLVTAACFQLGFVTLAFGIELLLSRGHLDGYLGMLLHYTNAHTALAMPLVVVWTMIDHPAVGFLLLFHAVITWMKLLSYIHANEDYRTSRGQHDDTKRMIQDLDPLEMDMTYPDNVSLGNILYFWCAPTLTYQIVFPKYPRIRWWKVFTILSRMAAVVMVSSFLVAQVVNPTLAGLLRDLEAGKEQQILIFVKYWLKLSITSTYLWLLIFYGYFHLYLNLFAELLRFGDRVFYRDWWNSATASAFWRLWNMPVHYWLVRHVYFPCIRLKMGKAFASIVVFLLSAVMHEVLVSVPFHVIRPWSFLGMMLQMPL